ncbi:hypothetical protein GCM10028807_09850 [Spirosoma daeguense]
MNVGTIILAAGDSSRMGGDPKQLLIYKEQTLVRRTTESALALQRGPVVVVLGANRDQIAPELAGLPVTLVDNSGWQTGQAGSLKTGLAALYLMNKNIDAVLVLHIDQPLVSIGLLQHILEVWKEQGKGIVACRYDTQIGVPALFSREYINELLQLEGDKGLQWVIVRHRDDRSEVPFEAGNIDLNTKRDVDLFRQAHLQAQ